MGIRGIWLNEQDSKLGSVETYADARKCANLFQANRRSVGMRGHSVIPTPT